MNYDYEDLDDYEYVQDSYIDDYESTIEVVTVFTEDDWYEMEVVF